MIVGTAGHIDHGKTTLVRALTGVDTDRLQEEKARGISIELGYAYTALADGNVLGFIDVPGHERLVHTMVAGATAIDFALLVIAADDGVMPQTREHLAILGLLGIAGGAVALTKADCVPAARLAAARQELEGALAGSPLADCSVFALNATRPDDPGVRALRAHLDAAAQQRQRQRPHRLFRLAADRVFTLPGHGTIVAGTVLDGEVRPGDTLAVMPHDRRARVRSIHVQNRPAALGRAGERCALNLTGIERSELARGDWLADATLFTPTRRMDVRLELLADCATALTAWCTVHAHLGTARRLAHVVLLEESALTAGHSARVQLVFDEPVCALPGDRLIVRDAQAAHTIGGGRVVDPYAPQRRRRSARRQRYLDALEQLTAGAGVAALLAEAPFGLSTTQLVQLTGLAAEAQPPPPAARVLLAAGQQFMLPAARWLELRTRVLTALREFHASAADEPGIDAARLRRIAFADMPELLWRALKDELLADGSLARSGAWLHLPEHSARLSAADETLAERLRPLLAAGRFDPPWVRTLAGQLQEPEAQVRDVLRKQAQRGAVYQVVHDLFYDAACIGELADVVSRLATLHGAVNAANYRDALGLGRKRAIQILEFFDRVGFTRRVRDAHLVRRGQSWRSQH
jgi:selenocysteine-specific elongation factor